MCFMFLGFEFGSSGRLAVGLLLLFDCIGLLKAHPHSS